MLIRLPLELFINHEKTLWQIASRWLISVKIFVCVLRTKILTSNVMTHWTSIWIKPNVMNFFVLCCGNTSYLKLYKSSQWFFLRVFNVCSAKCSMINWNVFNRSGACYCTQCRWKRYHLPGVISRIMLCCSVSFSLFLLLMIFMSSFWMQTLNQKHFQAINSGRQALMC